jgi:starvation-inducible DNA-binding protein
MNINTGLKESSRSKILQLLATLLSDEYLLYTKTRHFHWNVTGPQFNDLHKFFEAQYTVLDTFVDDTAERSRALGGKAIGSMRQFLSQTRLDESTSSTLKAEAMLADLLHDHEKIIRFLRLDVDRCTTLGDQGTADFLTGLMEEHEKMAWMLRSYIA